MAKVKSSITNPRSGSVTKVGTPAKGPRLQKLGAEKAKARPGGSRAIQPEGSIAVIELPADLHSKMMGLADAGLALMARYHKSQGKSS